MSNPVADMLVTTVENGIKEIEEANKVLLAEDESGTSVREIDKMLKGGVPKKEGEEPENELPESVLNFFLAALEAKKVYTENLNEARNAYRVEVLGEEAQETSEDEIDKDAVKEKRQEVLKALDFLKTFAAGNGLPDLVKWADEQEIPQVGRKGTSTVSGVKRPRVYVKVNGTVYESFTDAAKDLSNKKWKITASELADLWDGTDGSEFEFDGVDDEGEKVLFEVSVKNKPKKSEA